MGLVMQATDDISVSVQIWGARTESPVYSVEFQVLGGDGNSQLTTDIQDRELQGLLSCGF